MSGTPTPNNLKAVKDFPLESAPVVIKALNDASHATDREHIWLYEFKEALNKAGWCFYKDVSKKDEDANYQALTSREIKIHRRQCYETLAKNWVKEDPNKDFNDAYNFYESEVGNKEWKEFEQIPWEKVSGASNVGGFNGGLKRAKTTKVGVGGIDG